MAEIEDVGDEEFVTKKKAVKRSLRDQELNDLKEILKTYGGRSFFWRLFTEARIYDSSYNTDHSVMSFREGKRDLGLWALREVEVAIPGVIDQMRLEAKERERK